MHSQHEDDSDRSLAGLVRAWGDLASQGAQIGLNAVTGAPAMLRFVVGDPLGLRQAFWDFWIQAWKDPGFIAQAPMALWSDYSALSQYLLHKSLGIPAEPLVDVDAGDRRFGDEAWSAHPYFDGIKQAYLLTARWLRDTVRGVEGLDSRSARKAQFYTQQMIDAFSPSNFALTNPEVLRETWRTRGHSLLRGLDNLAQDLARSKGSLSVRMTRADAFEVGRDLAASPGEVVYQNEVMQLIQYSPASTKVARRPLLLIAPPMNKYYILDLRPDNSLVRWLVEAGQTVFCISWVNPDARHAKLTLSDYIRLGPLAALDAIEAATGEPQVNALGYCYGGILLACALALHDRAAERRIKSATFLATMLDFEDVGEIRIMLDPDRFPQLERAIVDEGYLDGRALSNAFRALRANELVWAYYVNNYLLGKDPPPFDLLYWNEDTTHMPAAMHVEFLRSMYLSNALRRPGGLQLLGAPIDLGDITTPTCFVSTLADHIAPWRSSHVAGQLLSGPVEFILGKAGHIAGIINAPARGKYGYWDGGGDARDPEAWLAAADYHEGSWWPAWLSWLEHHAGGEVPARHPGTGELGSIEPAPGSYVRARVDTGPLSVRMQ